VSHANLPNSATELAKQSLPVQTELNLFRNNQNLRTNANGITQTLSRLHLTESQTANQPRTVRHVLSDLCSTSVQTFRTRSTLNVSFVGHVLSSYRRLTCLTAIPNQFRTATIHNLYSRPNVMRTLLRLNLKRTKIDDYSPVKSKDRTFPFNFNYFP
jgi:hypothetical protein